MSAPADATTALKARFPQVTDRASLDHPAVNVPIADLPAVLRSLRDEFTFDLLTDVTAIDWAEGASPRFTMVYHLLSTSGHAYLRVAANCASDTAPEAPSVVNLWPGANWHEREVYDMFGIKFAGHPDLRRILMWDEFKGHPMRKDYVEPDDYEWEPTPHGAVLEKAKKHYPAAPAGAPATPAA